MRIKLARTVTIIVIILNIVALFFIWKLLSTLDKVNVDYDSKSYFSKPIDNLVSGNSVTLVIRKFEHFENDVVGTVHSFISKFPSIKVLIVSDVRPYPPIDISHLNKSSSKIRILDLEFKLTDRFGERNPLLYIDTKYVLFVPDSTRFRDKVVLKRLLNELQESKHKVVAASFINRKLAECLRVKLSPQEWFIQYTRMYDDICDAVTGKHVVLLETQLLGTLTAPFMLPFPESFYIQTSAHHIKVKLVHSEKIVDGKQLYHNQHALQKVEQLEASRREQMFRHLGFKKVVRETGTTEWYGCSRETPRCFGTVIGDMPEYLWQGRWTPPCCLAGLRRTAQHVFSRLERDGVRYWLEGGTLLGAMRSGDILPWDYDIDIGVIRDDVARCPWLVRAQSQSVIDEDGFVWEKAREGDFFRVQYSPVNHLHVDIFPFYSRNGTMTKDTWFPTHKQDREFPEHFLKPLSTIEFLGRKVSAPNNIRDFLELKFGKGAIENPEYPDPQRLKFLTKHKLSTVTSSEVYPK